MESADANGEGNDSQSSQSEITDEVRAELRRLAEAIFKTGRGTGDKINPQLWELVTQSQSHRDAYRVALYEAIQERRRRRAENN